MSKTTGWKPSGTVMHEDTAAQEESFIVFHTAPFLASAGSPIWANSPPAVVAQSCPNLPCGEAPSGDGEPAKAPATPRHAGVRACPGECCCPVDSVSPSVCMAGFWPRPISLRSGDRGQTWATTLVGVVDVLNHFMKSDGPGWGLAPLLLKNSMRGLLGAGLTACNHWYPACYLWHKFFLRHQGPRSLLRPISA